MGGKPIYIYPFRRPANSADVLGGIYLNHSYAEIEVTDDDP